MSRATAVIFSLILLFASSCAHQKVKTEDRVGPYAKTIMGEYDRVWRATQKALEVYPIRMNNIDTGIIETDIIRGLNVWTPAHNPTDKEPGLRYFLRLNLIKGNVRGKESVQVLIEKVKTIEKNFFAKEKRLGSDGFEERSLIYRIERQLQLERSLDRAYQNNKI